MDSILATFKEGADMTTLFTQCKMTSTMTMKEQIEMPGLEIMTLSQLQWNHTYQPFWIEDGRARLV